MKGRMERERKTSDHVRRVRGEGAVPHPALVPLQGLVKGEICAHVPQRHRLVGAGGGQEPGSSSSIARRKRGGMSQSRGGNNLLSGENTFLRM